jgi:hypothetical protein
VFGVDAECGSVVADVCQQHVEIRRRLTVGVGDRRHARCGEELCPRDGHRHLLEGAAKHPGEASVVVPFDNDDSRQPGLRGGSGGAVEIQRERAGVGRAIHHVLVNDGVFHAGDGVHDTFPRNMIRRQLLAHRDSCQKEKALRRA